MYSDFVITEVGLPRNCWIQSIGADSMPTPANMRKKSHPVNQVVE
jgi:hypothetical protein